MSAVSARRRAHRSSAARAPRRAQSDGRLPSVVAGVLRDGELAWSGGYGDVPGDVLDVQYRIGSITKTLTAVLVLQLVRDGRLSLDDPASAVLGDVGYADRTIRSLLAHNAGIRSEPVGSWWERSAGLTWDELVGAHEGADAVFPARAAVPLLEPRVRAARRGRGEAVRRPVVGSASGPGSWTRSG